MQLGLSERRINISLTFTKHEIAGSRQMKGPIMQYRVGGLSRRKGRSSPILEDSPTRRVGAYSTLRESLILIGYKTADDALAALQNEY
jgi:hypothetical protein